MPIRDILQTAFEQIGELESGESLTAEQIDQGLARLNGILADMPQFGVGKRLQDVAVSADLIACPNTRCLVGAGASAQVTFPTSVGDGARVQIITATTNATWMYRADLGDWLQIGTVTATDDSPYPVEFDDTLALLLATKLAPLAQAPLHPAVATNLQSGLVHMKARYFQRVPTGSDPALLRPSRQAYQPDSWSGDCPPC